MKDQGTPIVVMHWAKPGTPNSVPAEVGLSNMMSELCNRPMKVTIDWANSHPLIGYPTVGMGGKTLFFENDEMIADLSNAQIVELMNNHEDGAFISAT